MNETRPISDEDIDRAVLIALAGTDPRHEPRNYIHVIARAILRLAAERVEAHLDSLRDPSAFVGNARTVIVSDLAAEIRRVLTGGKASRAR